MSAETILDLVIEGLGAGGDGVTGQGAARTFVPYTLPGERVRVVIESATQEGRRARLIEVVTPSPKRRSPPCPHFGTCGGCALQHMTDENYVGFKLARLMGALSHRGFKEVPLAPVRQVRPGARRRVRFAAARSGDRVVLGFRGARDHAIVDLSACPVAEPAIERVIGPLRTALATLLPPRVELEIAITATPGGLDVLMIGPLDGSAESRIGLATLARDLGLARLSWCRSESESPELIAATSTPVIRLGGVDVPLPPDAFVQPTTEGEAAIVEAVLGATKGVKRAADLFCGLGTIALPLAGKGIAVEAYDSSAEAIAALEAASRAAGLAGKLKPVRQDLMRSPLPSDALDRFDLVVFDPPRIGAEAQAAMLARSRVRTVIAVSCNPATFARDTRMLADGGYRLERVIPLDQFLWTPHVEVIAVLRR